MTLGKQLCASKDTPNLSYAMRVHVTSPKYMPQSQHKEGQEK
jgi:hypothetical protein